MLGLENTKKQQESLKNAEAERPVAFFISYNHIVTGVFIYG